MASNQALYKSKVQVDKTKECNTMVPFHAQDISHITDVEVLSVGLYYAGFDKSRPSMNLDTNICRFKASYGINPKAVCAMFADIKEKYPSQNLTDVLMTMNWVKLYNSWEVVAGHWGYSKPVVARKVKDAALMVQSLRYKKINFDCIQKNKTYIMSVVVMHCETKEFHLRPRAKWYSQKKSTSSLTYDIGCPIHHDRCLWLQGPFQAGKNMFCKIL